MRKYWIFGIVAILTCTVVYFVQKQQKKFQRATEVILSDSVNLLVQPSPTLVYGFPVDSFKVDSLKVRWNQTLSTILERYNTSNEKIFAIAEACKGVFDVRRLKVGHPYVVIHEGGESKNGRQLILEPDATGYIVFNLIDSIYVKRVSREIIHEERVLTATITSSVYEAVIDQGSSPLLVSKLVDIFAWQVDFFRIQKGDSFKVIYEEERVGDQTVAIGKVLGASFVHFGKEYYAIYYDQGGKSDYFDEEGNSLRKTFLKAPLNYSRISSRYSPRRYHPVQKRFKAHLGTDYAAPVGTPIRTVGDGIILEARYGKYNGNYVKIKHNSNYSTQYLHMSKIARGMRPGTQVKQGQTIGYVGSTGLANGPHLCFRFWKGGHQVDALKVDLPPTEPIDPSELLDFLHTKNVTIHRLNNLQTATTNRVLAENQIRTP